MLIRERRAEDFSSVRALLQRAGLPLEGLEKTRGWVAWQHDGVVAHVAVDETPKGIVLRSLVVAESARGKGLGRALLARAEEASAPCCLYLRTRTIEDWVRRRGYRAVTRAEVPDEVRQTAEFSGALCASVPIYHKQKKTKE